MIIFHKLREIWVDRKERRPSPPPPFKTMRIHNDNQADLSPKISLSRWTEMELLRGLRKKGSERKHETNWLYQSTKISILSSPFEKERSSRSRREKGEECQSRWSSAERKVKLDFILESFVLDITEYMLIVSVLHQHWHLLRDLGREGN